MACCYSRWRGFGPLLAHKKHCMPSPPSASLAVSNPAFIYIYPHQTSRHREQRGERRVWPLLSSAVPPSVTSYCLAPDPDHDQGHLQHPAICRRHQTSIHFLTRKDSWIAVSTTCRHYIQCGLFIINADC